MAYAHAFVIPGARELYDALHAEFRRYPAEEMILHVDPAGLIVPSAGIDS